MLEPSPAPRLVVHLLGEFRVEYNGQPLSGLAGDRPQSLLAYLLLHRHAPQSRRHLSFLLWPDSSEAQARSNLRNLFFMLRQALPDADAWLLSDTATIQWRPDAPLAFDVAEFRDHLAAARRHAAGREQDACAGALEAAIAAYGGDLLPGNYDDWLLSLREDLRAEFAEALRQLAALHESRGDYAAALRPAGRYLQTDPLNEGAYIQLMRLHALLGDRAAVQRLYQTCTTLLRRELDVDPSPATQAAFQELLRLEPVHVAVHVPAPPACCAGGDGPRCGGSRAVRRAGRSDRDVCRHPCRAAACACRAPAGRDALASAPAAHARHALPGTRARAGGDRRAAG